MPTLSYLVDPDPLGFIPQWQARDITRRVLNLIEKANFRRIPLVMLSLDTEKVFHKVC